MYDHEDTASIWKWQRDTFSAEILTDSYQISRAMDELEEAHVVCFTTPDNTHAITQEAVDAIIVLMGIVGKRGYDLQSLIDTKMATNRTREWELRLGKWQHVDD